MSDTPISDSTPHNVADLGMLCRRLERELNVANERIERFEEALNELHSNESRWLNSNGELERRIKRLEEAGDEMHRYIFDQTNTRWIICAIQWREAKEAKP
jgi:chromosome segregation ATPase